MIHCKNDNGKYGKRGHTRSTNRQREKAVVKTTREIYKYYTGKWKATQYRFNNIFFLFFLYHSVTRFATHSYTQRRRAVELVAAPQLITMIIIMSGIRFVFVTLSIATVIGQSVQRAAENLDNNSLSGSIKRNYAPLVRDSETQQTSHDNCNVVISESAGGVGRLSVPSVKLSISSRSFSVSLLFGMLYLITLEIPPFPLMSSNVT